MSTIAFIPARGGSKGVPRKNIKLLGGKPLIAYSIEQAMQSGLHTIVSTDDDQIKDVALAYGASVLDRPAELSGDDVSMYEVLKSEILKIDPVPDIVVVVSPTSPMRKAEDISNALMEFVMSPYEFDSLVTVEDVPGHYNPAQVLVKAPEGIRMADGRRLSERITGRQAYPQAFVTNSGIYIFRTKNLSGGSFWGDETMTFHCESNIDINTLEDFAKAEIIANQWKI